MTAALKSFTLDLLPEIFAVVQLESGAALPDWATTGELYSVTRTQDELSIVCPQASIPEGVTAQKNFRCLKVQGPLAFSEVGVLASLSTILAKAQISIFVLSTFDTDYLLVASTDLSSAISALTAAGHEIAAAKQ